MATLEVWDSRGHDYFNLVSDTVVVGTAADAGLVLADPTVSSSHVLFERVGGVWLVNDLGSLNGTAINGRRMVGQQRLRHGDELVVGRTKLVFRDQSSERRPPTTPLDDLPALTRREREVLVALCLPLLSGSPFTPPASVRTIADQLCVGRGAVQAHLLHLYDKFGIRNDVGDDSARRVRLANEAVQRGAVTASDLRND